AYVNASQIQLYRQPNFQDLCNTYWQDQSDLLNCASQAVSVRVLPFTQPTPVPTVAGDPFFGNIAPVAYRDHVGSDATVDGRLDDEWIAGHLRSLGFSWSGSAT